MRGDILKLPQSIGLGSVRNARELGGYPASGGRRVKSNLLLRSASLSAISPEDTELLQKKYGLEMVVDFRSCQEAGRNADILPGTVAYTLLPAMSGNSQDKASNSLLDKVAEQPLNQLADLALQYLGGSDGMKSYMIEEIYRRIARERVSAEAYGAFFRILLDAKSAVLCHCTSGKDRTGIAVALLLTVLGVERDIIMQDYLLTNKYLKIEEAAEADGLVGGKFEQLLPLQGVDESYLYIYFDEIEKIHGSVELYLEKIIGLDAGDRERLIEKYTEIV